MNHIPLVKQTQKFQSQVRSSAIITNTCIGYLYLHFLTDPLLMDMELEDMRNRMLSLEDRQEHIKSSQATILQMQNRILRRLDVIERSLQPHMHSMPYQYAQPSFPTLDSSGWQNQPRLDEEYDSASYCTDAPFSFNFPTNYNSPLTQSHGFNSHPQTNRQSFESAHPPTNHNSPLTPSHGFNSRPQTNRQSFESTHSPTNHNSPLTPSHGFNSRPQTNRQSFESAHPQYSLDSHEPFPIKSTGHNLPSSEIDKAELQPVETILRKFPKLQCESKIGTLAIKLAKVAIFGDKVLFKCTVMGERELPGLPAAELMELKRILFRLFLNFWVSRHEFEPLWKVYVDALGQACLDICVCVGGGGGGGGKGGQQIE